jgi:hypothetical protein
MPASYDGVQIFGRSVKIKHVKAPTEFQYNAFFGLDGVFSLYAGQRGRSFFVEGVLTGSNIAAINAAIAAIEDYDDGIGRDLVDTRGRTWPSVVFEHFEETTDLGVLCAPGGGRAVAYRASFAGRI